MSDWQGRVASVRCLELCNGLEHLGFTVRKAGSSGHKVISHADLPEFWGANFNCGHGTNDYVKPVYVRKILRVLSENSDELEQLC